MKRKLLGRTGLHLSELGMGTIQLARLEWKESIRLLREVRDMGVNFFDTGRGYFDSELRLAEAFKGMREDVVLITKSGAKTPEALKTDIDESLKRLGTDYIDIFMFHTAVALEQDCLWDMFGVIWDAKDAGKIRCSGFSAHKVKLALRALQVSSLSVAMIPANFISREYIDGEFMSEAQKCDVGVLGMKPFGGGRITDVGPSLRFLKGYADLFPCIGIEHAGEMWENIGIWDSAEGLTEEDRDYIWGAKEILGNSFCRACGYCMPCPEGIRIPTVTFMQVYAKQMPRSWVVSDAHQEVMDQARKCTECRKCVEKCPFDLNIPEMLKDNIRFYEDFACLKK